MATEVKISQPVEYYRKYLEQDVRPDGRSLGEIRNTILNIGSISTAEGSALVKLGNTTILCGIKAELTQPKAADPKKGFIVPNVDLPSLCSPQFKPGPPSEQAQVITKFMDDVLKNSRCIDEESLCIEEGKLVWVLFCDMVCLDHDGNLPDACTISLLAALKNVKLPTITINEDNGLPESDFSKTVGLQVAAQPVSTTFAIFDDRIIFADPTSEEEVLSTGLVTIVTMETGQLCMVHKPGGSSISETRIQDCILRSQTRTKEVCQLIDETINTVER